MPIPTTPITTGPAADFRTRMRNANVEAKKSILFGSAHLSDDEMIAYIKSNIFSQPDGAQNAVQNAFSESPPYSSRFKSLLFRAAMEQALDTLPKDASTDKQLEVALVNRSTDQTAEASVQAYFEQRLGNARVILTALPKEDPRRMAFEQATSSTPLTLANFQKQYSEACKELKVPASENFIADFTTRTKQLLKAAKKLDTQHNTEADAVNAARKALTNSTITTTLKDYKERIKVLYPEEEKTLTALIQKIDKLEQAAKTLSEQLIKKNPKHTDLEKAKNVFYEAHAELTGTLDNATQGTKILKALEASNDANQKTANQKAFDDFLQAMNLFAKTKSLQKDGQALDTTLGYDAMKKEFNTINTGGALQSYTVGKTFNISNDTNDINQLKGLAFLDKPCSFTYHEKGVDKVIRKKSGLGVDNDGKPLRNPTSAEVLKALEKLQNQGGHEIQVTCSKKWFGRGYRFHIEAGDPKSVKDLRNALREIVMNAPKASQPAPVNVSNTQPSIGQGNAGQKPASAGGAEPTDSAAITHNKKTP